MACNNEIHENDIGTEFIATITECDGSGMQIPLDISTATLIQITFRNPLGVVTTKAVSFTSIDSGGTGTGSDGKISYFTVDQDLVPSGAYRIQGIVTTPAGKWSSSIERFNVVRNLV